MNLIPPKIWRGSCQNERSLEPDEDVTGGEVSAHLNPKPLTPVSQSTKFGFRVGSFRRYYMIDVVSLAEGLCRQLVLGRGGCWGWCLGALVGVWGQGLMHDTS